MQWSDDVCVVAGSESLPRVSRSQVSHPPTTRTGRSPHISTTFSPDAMKGKVALVTGAGSGIGRASALAFAAAGAAIVVSDVVTEGGAETVRLVRDAGGEATFIRADVS